MEQSGQQTLLFIFLIGVKQGPFFPRKLKASGEGSSQASHSSTEEVFKLQRLQASIRRFKLSDSCIKLTEAQVDRRLYSPSPFLTSAVLASTLSLSRNFLSHHRQIFELNIPNTEDSQSSFSTSSRYLQLLDLKKQLSARLNVLYDLNQQTLTDQ